MIEKTLIHQYNNYKYNPINPFEIYDPRGERLNKLNRNFQLSVLLPSLSPGLIKAIILVSMEISLAVLIFSDDLVQFLLHGIGMMLVGTVIVTIFIALTSSLVNMIGVPQDTPPRLWH